MLPGGARKTPLQVSVEGFVYINVPKMFLLLGSPANACVYETLFQEYQSGFSPFLVEFLPVSVADGRFEA